MLATDQFVYIHQPKTGGTFVHDVLFQVYGASWHWYHGLILAFQKNVSLKSRRGKILVGGKKHDACQEIDQDLLNERTILSNIRNPLDQYVSQFKFGWWRRIKYLKYYNKIPDFKEKYKNFPNISFEEFMSLEYDAYHLYPNNGFHDETSYGLQTMRFIKYYSRNPESVLKRFAAGELKAKEIKDTLYEVEFLRTHNLNFDLFNYLVKLGFKSEELEFILTKKKVLPMGKGRTKEQKWQKYYTADLHDLVVKKDKVIFELFPEFLSDA